MTPQFFARLFSVRFPVQRNPSATGPGLADAKSEAFPCGRGFLLISLITKANIAFQGWRFELLAILIRVYGDELARGIWRRWRLVGRVLA
jgi:hypothetical protein